MELLVKSYIHNVFHVSFLKKSLNPIVPISDHTPLVIETLEILSQLKAILDTHVIQKGYYQLKTKFLVKWVSAHVKGTTWENYWRFSKTYPNVNLVDKVASNGGV